MPPYNTANPILTSDTVRTDLRVKVVGQHTTLVFIY